MPRAILSLARDAISRPRILEIRLSWRLRQSIRIAIAQGGIVGLRFSLTAALVAGIAAISIPVPSASGLGQGGFKGNNNSWFPVLSADGRYVAFASQATNISADDLDPTDDVYVRDLQT